MGGAVRHSEAGSLGGLQESEGQSATAGVDGQSVAAFEAGLRLEEGEVRNTTLRDYPLGAANGPASTMPLSTDIRSSRYGSFTPRHRRPATSFDHIAPLVTIGLFQGNKLFAGIGAALKAANTNRRC